MEQYISKSTLIAEIERRIKNLYPKGGQGMVVTKILQDHYEDLLSFLNTLEVKEVDLEKEIDNIWNPRFNLGWDEKSLLSMNHEGFTTTAKHFFELGMAASIKAQKVELVEQYQQK